MPGREALSTRRYWSAKWTKSGSKQCFRAPTPESQEAITPGVAENEDIHADRDCEIDVRLESIDG